jgi:hypothetical protein
MIPDEEIIPKVYLRVRSLFISNLLKTTYIYSAGDSGDGSGDDGDESDGGGITANRIKHSPALLV